MAKRRLVVEVKGGSHRNKGDGLMLLALQRAMRARFGGGVVFSSRSDWPVAEPRFGLLRMAPLATSHANPVRNVVARMANRFLGTRLGGHLGVAWGIVVSGRRVDALMDISGFPYSDHWSEWRMPVDRDTFAEARRSGRKIVLMPKTYGPFSSENQRALMLEILQLSDVTFVRDRQSLDFLVGIGADAHDLHLAPDYTGDLTPTLDSKYNGLANGACIIPNYRMVDKVANVSLAEYARFVEAVAQGLLARGIRPFVLLHEDKSDPEVVAAFADESLEVVREDDPLVLKGIIGRSSVVFSSRLHGLISALSQGVPAVALGWAHKYSEVMRDYGVPEYNLEWPVSPDEVMRTVGALIDEAGEYDRVRAVLIERQNGVSAANASMWDLVAARLA